MSGFLFDSNVLLDAIYLDSVWQYWPKERIGRAVALDRAFINPIIYAELAPAFDSQEALERWLDSARFRRLDLSYDAGWRAGQAFARYRRAGGPRKSLLPDFYIGAHAEIAGLTLVTRDVGRYATYFPAVTLVAPGT